MASFMIVIVLSEGITWIGRFNFMFAKTPIKLLSKRCKSLYRDPGNLNDRVKESP